jgi:hypothetical protein
MPLTPARAEARLSTTRSGLEYEVVNLDTLAASSTQGRSSRGPAAEPASCRRASVRSRFSREATSPRRLRARAQVQREGGRENRGGGWKHGADWMIWSLVIWSFGLIALTIDQ